MQTMTEERFAEVSRGIELSDVEVAVLRKSFGLSYDKGRIPSTKVFEKHALMQALTKLPEQSQA